MKRFSFNDEHPLVGRLVRNLDGHDGTFFLHQLLFDNYVRKSSVMVSKLTDDGWVGKYIINDSFSTDWSPIDDEELQALAVLALL